MKKQLLLLATLICWQSIAQGANLIEVYKQALTCDPVFQKAVAQRLSTKEEVPISVSAILPNIQLTANPSVSRYGYSGSQFDPVVNNSGTYINPRNLTVRAYTLNISLTQTVFNFNQFYVVTQSIALSKEADATLNAALQDLMTRVSKAYFAILQDEDNLTYAEASKVAYAEQLDQIREQYKVGLKTLTDVYTAQSSYDTAVATVIQNQTTLANDKENLRVMTGIYYDHLSSLSENFPLLSPQPNNVEAWVRMAILHNWNICASRYAVSAAREVINQNVANHLPTANVVTSWSRQFNDNINLYTTFAERHGPGNINDKSITLNINVPIFSGGGVVAHTNQAKFDYQVAQQELEQTIRSTVNTARQSFLNIVSGISKIKADKEAIKSAISSLEGLEASYQVGTETLVDVLNQQQQVFQKQTQYATDRYAFVNNILSLKQAAGTLSFEDLCGINAWLTDQPKKLVTKRFRYGHLNQQRVNGSEKKIRDYGK